MPHALWLIALPIGSVPLVYLFRRQALGAILAAIIAALSAWLTGQLSAGTIVKVFGRAIHLSQFSQITLGLLFTASAILFLIPALAPSYVEERRRRTGSLKQSHLNQHGGVQGREGRTFYPVGLIILGIFVIASFTHHLRITAIFIEVAAILTVFIIQGGRLTSTRASLRFLSLMSLATPFFLLATWQIDFYLLNKGARSADSLTQTAFLLGIGFALWLAVVPFHGWVTAVATDCYPSSATFVLIVFPVMTFSTLINLLIEFPDIVSVPNLANVILIAGVATAFASGLLASLQRGFSELLGYTALYDLGCTLALLGIGGPAPVLVILVSLAVRALALILLAASTSAIRSRYASDGFAQIKGVAMKMPLATIGLLMGGLTLAGMPLTAGFAPHWVLLAAAAKLNILWAVLLALAGLGVAIGYLRGFYQALLIDETIAQSKIQLSTRLFPWLQEPIWLLLVISLLMVTCLIWGVFPALLIEPLQKYLPQDFVINLLAYANLSR